MKKTLSVIVSAVLGAAALTAPVYAVSTTETSDTKTLAVFGDSISTGFSALNGSVEYNYGEICADYLGWDVVNKAHDGDRVDDLYNLIVNDASAAQAAADAEVIVISIGGNDVIRYTAKYILDYAVQYSLLKDGYTEADIPEDPSMEDMRIYLDKDKLMTYLSSNLQNAAYFLNQLKVELVGTNAEPTGFVQTSVIPDTQAVIDKLQELNPDAEIVLQTVYQPLQFSQEVWNASFATGAPYADYGSALSQLRINLTSAMKSYRTAITDLAAAETGVLVADIYEEFTSVASPSVKNQGYASYFTDIEAAADENGVLDFNSVMENSDFHPNQKGHLAIASAVLEQIGELHDTGSDTLLRSVYEGLEDKAEYPEIALETYVTVAGDLVEPTTEPTTEPATTTTATTTAPVTTTSAIECYMTQLEYDSSPMKVGETRAVRFYHPKTGTASTASFMEVSDNISYSYEEGSDTVYITALEPGEAKMYIMAEDCAFGAYVNITVEDAVTTTTTATTTAPVTTTTTVTTTTPSTTEPEPYSLGDANGDSKVDGVDASLVLQEYARIATKQDTTFGEAQTFAADVNKDTKVDGVDASAILGYYAHKATGGTGSIEDYLNQN